MRPEDTGTRGGARQHREGCFGADPASVRPGQQDLRGAERADAGLGCDQPGGHLIDDLADLVLELGGDHGEAGDPLAEADQGLVSDPDHPVSSSGAGQRGAGRRPATHRGTVPRLEGKYSALGPPPGAWQAGAGALRAAGRARSR